MVETIRPAVETISIQKQPGETSFELDILDWQVRMGQTGASHRPEWFMGKVLEGEGNVAETINVYPGADATVIVEKREIPKEGERKFRLTIIT